MTGQLQVFYKNGEIRHVMLNPPFFKEARVSLATRALDIAHSHNPEPWKIFVYKDAQVKFEKVIPKNDPKPLVGVDLVKKTPQTVIERRKAVKRFKKELKRAA